MSGSATQDMEHCKAVDPEGGNCKMEDIFQEIFYNFHSVLRTWARFSVKLEFGGECHPKKGGLS